MRGARAVLVLLGVQLLLVLSVAGRYAYERKMRPRVWVRATEFDPDEPLRGRYLALRLLVDGCGLPRDGAHFVAGYPPARGGVTPGMWRWTVSLEAVGGQLVPRWAEKPRVVDGVQQVTLGADARCDRAMVEQGVEYFVPERAKGPFPLKAGQELWVEVTVPKSGPPRPIQLAMASGGEFRPLLLREP